MATATKYRLDRKITLKKWTITTSNTTIGEAKVEATIATPRAHVIAQVGTETFLGDQRSVVKLMTFTIRYREDFDEEAWIEYLGKIYDIIDIQPIDRNRWIEIKGQRRG